MEKIMFIEKLDMISDVELVNKEVDNILQFTDWSNNQISLKHKIGATNIWKDGVGSLYNHITKTSKNTESEFTEWSIDKSNYIRNSIENLEEKFKFKSGRIRIMKLLPRSGLSVHYDNEVRYHLVLKTNPKSYICHNNNSYNIDLTPIAQCYHMPLDNHWYLVDTRNVHWVYNGGITERIHIVVCSL